MFPVKWNKLQLTVDINFDVVVQSVLLCLCFLGKGRRREKISSSFKRRRRNSRVEAMKHQGSPLICIMYSRRLQREREKLSRLPDATRKWIKLFHHKHPVLNVADSHTQVYHAVSVRGRKEREPSFPSARGKTAREKSSEGEIMKTAEWEWKFFATTSVVEISRRKETWSHSSFNCLLYDRKTQRKRQSIRRELDWIVKSAEKYRVLSIVFDW